MSSVWIKPGARVGKEPETSPLSGWLASSKQAVPSEYSILSVPKHWRVPWGDPPVVSPDSVLVGSQRCTRADRPAGSQGRARRDHLRLTTERRQRSPRFSRTARPPWKSRNPWKRWSPRTSWPQRLPGMFIPRLQVSTSRMCLCGAWGSELFE